MTAAASRNVLTFARSAGAEEEIIGANQGLQRVWEAVRLVAPFDSTVLIHGETGTGKELIARAIHERSRRSHAPYVKVNCAAIPGGLLESELFGHERGAFTGALAQTTGRFQLAHGGTLFLDEVGDLPLELQPKLLRVLQEQEFERLGSTRTIRVDIRIVAATNLDLAELVRERRFRPDLYYRLNVFPITLPPLRARIEDIPDLVWHFVRKFTARMDRVIEVIPEEAMEILQRYSWPGNIRELQNFVERSVVLSSGPALRPPLGELKALTTDAALPAARTLVEAEKDYIVEALRQTGGVVGGSRGAAARLGLKRSTLQSRIQKLGIGQPESSASDSMNRAQNPLRFPSRSQAERQESGRSEAGWRAPEPDGGLFCLPEAEGAESSHPRTENLRQSSQT